MITGYAGHELICGNCRTSRRELGFELGSTHILWANQHAESIRLFCRKCCHYTDFTTNKKPVTKPIDWNPLKGQCKNESSS